VFYIDEHKAKYNLLQLRKSQGWWTKYDNSMYQSPKDFKPTTQANEQKRKRSPSAVSHRGQFCFG
jgi:hypothetical protein